MHVVHIDPVSAETREAVIHFLGDPASGQSLVVWLLADCVGHFGGEHPARAIFCNQSSHHTLRFAIRVIISSVDRVEPCVTCDSYHLARDVFVCLVAKHHRS